MKTLQLDLKKAKKLFPTASPEFKEMLIDSFGPETFSDKITDKCKSWEDACEIKGIHPHQSLPYPDPQNDQQQAINGFFKMITISEVLNEGWSPNYSNSSEYKYYPWFDLSGGGFSYRDYGYAYAGASVGARLVYKTRELAIYAGKQFTDIYKSFFSF